MASITVRGAPSAPPSRLQAVLQLLAEAGVTLDPDTSPANFLERLHVALVALAGRSRGADDDDGELRDDPIPPPAQPPAEENSHPSVFFGSQAANLIRALYPRSHRQTADEQARNSGLPPARRTRTAAAAPAKRSYLSTLSRGDLQALGSAKVALLHAAERPPHRDPREVADQIYRESFAPPAPGRLIPREQTPAGCDLPGGRPAVNAVAEQQLRNSGRHFRD